MKKDLVVQEVRAVWERLFAEHGCDLEKYVRFLQQRQKEDPWPIARKKARTTPITRWKCI